MHLTYKVIQITLYQWPVLLIISQPTNLCGLLTFISSKADIFFKEIIDNNINPLWNPLEILSSWLLLFEIFLLASF